jgi:hypothetical protein
MIQQKVLAKLHFGIIVVAFERTCTTQTSKPGKYHNCAK